MNDSSEKRQVSSNGNDALLTRLRFALYQYGGHISPCPGRPCECGFLAEWQAAQLPVDLGDVMRIARLLELPKLTAHETGELQRLKDQLAYCELSLRNYDDGVSEYWLRYPSDEPHAQKALEPLSMDQTQEVLGAVSHELMNIPAAMDRFARRHEMNESMTDVILTSNERLGIIKQTPRQASIDDIEWLCEEVERLQAGILYEVENASLAPSARLRMRALVSGSHETGERLNRLQLERLALQAINSLPCPDAEPLAKALDDQFERVTGYRTKNWPHGAETMRLERAHALKAGDRREYHANGTYWSGVPTVDMPCDFCHLAITAHDPRTHACPSQGKEGGA